MNRRNFIRKAGTLASISLFLNENLFAYKSIPELEEVRKGTGIFTINGGTMGWLINKNGVVVIDSGFPNDAKNFKELVLSKETGKEKLLINTHHHSDHTSGNIEFKDWADKVISHKNAKKNLENVAQLSNTMDKQFLPTEVFDKNWERKFGNEKIEATYFGEAHTNGDIVIHFTNANVAHLGDLVFNRKYPYIDRSAGASIKGWINVLTTLTKHFTKDTIFIYGHAGNGFKNTGNLNDLEAMRIYFEKLLDFVRKKIAEGKTKETILGYQEFPYKTDWNGKGIERSLTAAYEELTEG